MMLLTLLLDTIIYNITPYKTHLFLLALPKEKRIFSSVLYFLMLSFFEWKFIFNLIILIGLFYLKNYINKNLRISSTLYIVEVAFFYVIYFSLMFLVVKLI